MGSRPLTGAFDLRAQRALYTLALLRAIYDCEKARYAFNSKLIGRSTQLAYCTFLHESGRYLIKPLGEDIQYFRMCFAFGELYVLSSLWRNGINWVRR